MSSKSTNEGEDEGLPLFSFSSSVYYYRVAYKISSGQRFVQYNSVHELILNLSSIKSNDWVTYVIREDGRFHYKCAAISFLVIDGTTIFNQDLQSKLSIRFGWWTSLTEITK